VIVMVCLYIHSIQAVCKKLAWSMFYRNLDQPDLDKILTIKELLCVKYGLLSLPLFDVSQIDFMPESLCTFNFYLLFMCTLCTIKYMILLSTIRTVVWHRYLSLIINPTLFDKPAG